MATIAQLKQELADLRSEKSLGGQPLKLNDSNWVKWKKSMQINLDGLRLWDVVKEEAPPIKTDVWLAKNAKAYAFIYNSCDSDQQDYIVDSESAGDAWTILEKRYERRNATTLTRYRAEFDKCVKLPTESASQYIARIKTVARQLKSCGETISENRLMCKLLEGLPKDYENLKSNFVLFSDSLTEDKVIDGILGDEQRLGLHPDVVAAKKEEKVSNKRFREDETLPNKNSRKKISKQCANCGIMGHEMSDCYDLNPASAPGNYRPKTEKGRELHKAYKNQGKKNDTRKDRALLTNEPEASELATLKQKLLDMQAQLNRAMQPNTESANLIKEWEERAFVNVEPKEYNGSKRWLLDSGASRHICSSREAFVRLVSWRQAKPITTGNGTILSLGMGDVKLDLSTGPAIIKDCLFAPTLTGGFHLFSTTQLNRKGYTTVQTQSRCEISKDAAVVATGTLTDDGWILDMLGTGISSMPDDRAFLSGSTSITSKEIWHKRLGHLGEENLSRLRKMSTGMEFGTPKPMTLSQKCRACINASQTTKKSYQPSSQVLQKLEVLHIDICGPMISTDLCGIKYFVTITDAKTRWTMTLPLLEKSELLQALIVAIARMERETGLRVQGLHFDNAGENVSNETRHWCQNRGIRITTTQPFSPEMNPIPERMNRTLVTKASAMLWESGLPIEFWWESIATATFVRNRSPTAFLLDITPYEAWYGKPPNLGHLKVFGCRVQAHVPKEHRSKWDARSSECVFLGYTDTENLYRLWDVHAQKIIFKRDCIFYEDEMGHSIFNGRGLPLGMEFLPITRAIAIQNSLSDTQAQKDTYTLLPLESLPGRQHIQKLPTVEPHSTSGNNQPHSTSGNNQLKAPLIFKHYQPIPALPPNRPKPRITAKIAEIQEEEVEVYLDYLEIPEIMCFSITEPSIVWRENVLLAPMDLQNVLPKSYRLALKDELWKGAMWAEYNALLANGTWEWSTLPAGKRAIPCKWVFDIKDNGDRKARLVARGDLQKEGEDFQETFAPVIKFVSVKILLLIASKRRLGVEHWDIVTAFLNGTLSEEIYIKPPPGFDTLAPTKDHVCRLKKAIYGLCQSARVFFQKMDEVLALLGFTRLVTDSALWVCRNLSVMVGCHVDDCMVIGLPGERQIVREHLQKYFKLKELSDDTTKLRYLSINIEKDGDAFFLDQRHKIVELLQSLNMTDCNGVNTPMLKSYKSDDAGLELDAVGKTSFKSILGSLLYIMNGTRPDIAYATIKLSQSASCPKEGHMNALKRVLRYLKQTVGARLRIAYDPHADDLVGYFDAAHADTPNKRSTCGYIFHLCGSPISWSSKVQKTVALSTTEAEYMAGTEAARELVWIKGILEGLDEKPTLPIKLYGDNAGANALSKNSQFHQRTKHIDLRHRYITQLYDLGILKVQYISTKEMLADGFTKPLYPEEHYKHFTTIGLQWNPLGQDPLIRQERPSRRLRCSCGNLFKGEAELFIHKFNTKHA